MKNEIKDSRRVLEMEALLREMEDTIKDELNAEIKMLQLKSDAKCKSLLAMIRKMRNE